jgi:phage shock protein E
MKNPYFLVLAALLPLAGHAQTSLPRPAAGAAQKRAPATPVPSVDPVTAIKLMITQHYVVLDVRTPAEFAAGHLKAAKNIDFRAPNFSQQLSQLDPKAYYLVYCASGNRSSQAAAVMQQQGIRNVTNAGGYSALRAAGAQ